MKTIVTILSSAAALCAAVAFSGFALDGVALFSIGASSVIAGIFASDYSRVPTYHLAPAPARKGIRTRRRDAGIEFATMATFNSMVG